MISLAARSPEKEILDLEIPDYSETVASYLLIQRVNRFLGGTEALLSCFKEFSKHWKKNSPVSILDVGCGTADIPRSLVDWGRKKGSPLSVTCLDLNEHALSYTQKNLSRYPEFFWVRASNSHLPFRDESFDYVISSMFFHHLENPEIVATLRNFNRIARRGIVVNDLVRNRLAYFGILSLSQFIPNRIFRFDAPLSVRRGFRPEEIRSLARQAGLDYLRFQSRYAFRFTLAGEKV